MAKSSKYRKETEVSESDMKELRTVLRQRHGVTMWRPLVRLGLSPTDKVRCRGWGRGHLGQDRSKKRNHPRGRP